MGQKVRLTEADLHNIVKESVNKVLNELSRNTVVNAISKMKANGANDRARHLGDLAVNNYGGKELADDGYTSDVESEHYKTMGLGRTQQVRNKIRGGSKAEDLQYDEDMENYEKLNPLKKMFTKKPIKHSDYGKPEFSEPHDRFMYGYRKTSDPKIAHQAAKFNKWAGSGPTSSSAFRK